MDIVERLKTVDISWSQEGEWCAEAADEIEWLRTNQSIIITMFRINMMRLCPEYSHEEFDKDIANILEEKE